MDLYGNKCLSVAGLRDRIVETDRAEKRRDHRKTEDVDWNIVGLLIRAIKMILFFFTARELLRSFSDHPGDVIKSLLPVIYGYFKEIKLEEIGQSLRDFR